MVEAMAEDDDAGAGEDVRSDAPGVGDRGVQIGPRDGGGHER